MKKNIIRAIVVGIITFFLCYSIYLTLEYRYLADKYQAIQKSVDNMFLDYISDIDIKVDATVEDDKIFETYTLAYEKLYFADNIYFLTSYKDKQVNSLDSESKIIIEPVLKKTKLYIYDKANKKERIDPEIVKFINESLESIAENMDNAEKCNMYIDALYEKLN